MMFDMGGIAGSILVLCQLYLIGCTNANNSPSITGMVYRVCEDTPIGAEAFTIKASDPDNDPLTFTLTGPNSGYFKVDKNIGNVSISRHLDRESGNKMELGVEVSDGPNTVIREVTIIINDANDNRPIFLNASYDIQIPENTTVGTSLFRVTATDADTGTAGIVQYRISQVNPKEGLSLFSIGQTTGEVRLNGSLNYNSLSTFYQLTINATDRGGKCYHNETITQSNIAISFVTVVDIPDLDPQFTGLPYVGEVKENSSVGQSVFRVKAIDPDVGVNDKLIYSIEDSTAEGLFTISPDDGVISVLSDIDREALSDTVTLTVKATESELNVDGLYANATATVQINILDINDNKPEFYKCDQSGDERSCVMASDFIGEVFEHSLGSISINMTVIDRDKISNTQIILEGDDKDIFSVEPQFTTSDSVVQLLIKKPQKLDFEEKQEIVLNVTATDVETGLGSTATITITINDINDNSPKFPVDTYKLKVAENSPDGTIIANITAEDPDTMDRGNIRYRLLPDSILLYFDVEPHTGAVYVKNKTLLDREVRSLYSATLQARDTENKTGTAVLEITLTDINDEHPKFNRDSYLVFVKEGGHFELKIEANDADDSDTPNSQIVYGIERSEYSDNFTIDTVTGVLRNAGELNREALDPNLNGKIELNVTATDKGTPPLSAMATVIIDIEDVNDNMPQFEASSYTFSVKEGEKGVYVGSVYARDLDQTADFNRISFSIIDGSFGNFIIRSFMSGDERGYRGDISVDPGVELDYEDTRKQFNLMVEATDLGQKKAVMMVEVNVLDVNDERPEFKPTKLVEVNENINSTEAIGSFTGYDKDGNHSLVYHLVSMKCRCNDYLQACNMCILDPTGEVRFDPKTKVDYELCDQVQIEARVVDELTEKGENSSVATETMVINILDVNDNAPEFISSSSVFFVVSETASKGTSVAGVTAIDRDSEINRDVKFEVTAVQFNYTDDHKIENMRILFDAVTTQQKDIYVGIIQTKEGLDMTLEGNYLVTVTATDKGGLSNSTILEIFTVDQRYKVELEFTSSEAEVEQKLEAIIRELTIATKTSVEIVEIRPVGEVSRASGRTIIVAYFVYPNGTALIPDKVETILSEPDNFAVLGQLGLKNVGKVDVIKQEPDITKYILLGIMAALIIVLVVLSISLGCTRRNYRRKLKAAKAMKSVSRGTVHLNAGPVVPGTNKYNMDGANPVLNLNFDAGMILDEESSDVDKVSMNSMDNFDMTKPKKDPKSISWINEEVVWPSEHTEALGAVLAQQQEEQSGSANAETGFSNPAFSTSDL